MKKGMGKRILAGVLVFTMLWQMDSVRYLGNVNTAKDGMESVQGAQEQNEGGTEEIDTNVQIQVVGEVEELRTESEKHFRMSDGSYMAVSYGMPVHYLDTKGKWQEIDNRLELSKTSESYGTYNLRATTEFSKSLREGIVFETSCGDTSVSMSVLDTFGVESGFYNRDAEADTTVEVENVLGNSIGFFGVDAEETEETDNGWRMEDILPEHLQDSVLYEEVFEDIDLLYTKYSHHVKEEIIVKEPQESYRYDFKLILDGVDAVLNRDGSVSLKDEKNEQVYYIPAPFMKDAAGAISYDASYLLSETTDGVILSVVADDTWMNDEDRLYPVSIDPTLIVRAGEESEAVYFAYTAQGTPDVDYEGLHSYVGYTKWNSLGESRSFLHFNILPEIPAGMTVVGAQLALFLDDYTYIRCAELGVGIYEVTDAKPASRNSYYDWIYDMTWNTMPKYDTSNMIDYTKVSLSGVDQYHQWDMTELIKRWYTEGTENRTVALTIVPGNYSDSYCADASFYAWGSVAPPVLAVAYRDNVGIEPYYTYNTLEIGHAGTAYIADATGQLKVAKGTVSYASTVNPFALSLVYNSDYFSANSTADYQVPMKMGQGNVAMCLGQGWTLDIIQTMKTEKIDDEEYICYQDGDGTKHYFRIDEKRNNADDSNDIFYYDEDGLGLKVKITNTTKTSFIMYDDYGNSWTFSNGRLTATADENGNVYQIHYNSANKITSVTQINKGQSAITIATFAYSGDYVSSITDAAGSKYEFVYTDNKLTAVKFKNITIASYTYSGNRLVTMKDEERTYVMKFAYSHGQVTRYQELGGSIAGKTVTIQYKDYAKTIYRLPGTDSVQNTTDDLFTYYLFDYAGRTINAYTTDVNNQILGATNAVYSGTGKEEDDGVNKCNNRMLQTAGIGSVNPTFSMDGTLYEETSGEHARTGLLSFKIETINNLFLYFSFATSSRQIS